MERNPNWNPEPFIYNATVTRVHDGDTIIADVDLGLNHVIRGVVVTLAQVNARELTEAGGSEAAEALRTLLPTGLAIRIHSHKFEKSGPRLIADVWPRSSPTSYLVSGPPVQQQLLAEGWVAAWPGMDGERPVPAWPRS